MSIHPLLNSPLTIRGTTFRNRLVFPPWQFNWATPDGLVTPRLENFFQRLAGGGCGLALIGGAIVSADSVSRLYDRILRIDSDRFLPGLAALCARIAAEGCVPGIQLVHVGRQGVRSADDPVFIAPSAVEAPFIKMLNKEYQVREMTLDDIERVVADFAAAARRAVQAGARLVEVLAGHGYLIHEFLSPRVNLRTDEYGLQNSGNRARFACRVIRAVREAIGDAIPLSVRISSTEFLRDGMEAEEYREIIPLFEAAGMDLLHVSVGVLETTRKMVPSGEEAPYLDKTRIIRQFTTVPVITVNGIRSAAKAESILGEGTADFVAIGRGQIADPAFGAKVRAGAAETINQCLQCRSCEYSNQRLEAAECVKYPLGDGLPA